MEEFLKMQNYTTKIEELSSISKKIFFEIPYDNFLQELDKKFENIKKTVSLKGFRKGKAPLSVVKKTFSIAAKQELIEDLINLAYNNAISSNDLKPIAQPSISGLKFEDDKPIEFQAIIELTPEIDLSKINYLGLNIEAISTNVTDEELNSMVASFLDSKAITKTIDTDKALEINDLVNIDIAGFENNVEKADLSAKSYIYTIGKEPGLIKELDTALHGMKAGEEKTVEVNFSNDYNIQEYAGKNIIFKLKVNSLQEKIIPELNDSLISETFQNNDKINDKDSYLSFLKESIKYNKEAAKQSDIRTKLIDELIKDQNFEVPNIEVERKLPEIKERAVTNTFSYYKNMPEYKDEIAKFIQNNEAQFRKSAINELRLSYILRSIAKHNNLTVVNSEIEEEFIKTAKAFNLSVEKFKEQYSETLAKEFIETSILEQKAFKFVIDKAIINEKA